MAPLDIQMLTDDEKIAQVCHDYWDCDENGKFPVQVAQVARNHGLKSNEITEFVYDNCNVFSEDYTCSKCGDMPAIDNRTAYSQMVKSGGRKIVCFSCQEEVNRLAQAERDLAKAEREAELNRQREAIQQHYSLISNQAPDVHSLTLEDVVYLLSFVRAAASEDFTVCAPLNSFARRLAPTYDYAQEIVIHLYEKRLLQVHPQSPLDAFLFEEEQPNKFYTFKAYWTLMTGVDADKTRQFISMLENTLRNPELRPMSWHNETLQLWQKVAFHECMEYLELSMEERDFDLQAGPKTHSVIENSLQVFSVSQIYNFTWGAVRDAADFLVTKKVLRSHAANTVPGSIQRKSERAQAEGWEVKRFRRDRNRPQTIVSEVLFDVALKIGSKGFDETPRPVIFQYVDERDVDDDSS